MTEQSFIALSTLPDSGRLIIYGCGEAGEIVRERLHSDRPDITVVCFLDSFAEGEANGLKVVKRDHLSELEGTYDLILIASAWWRDIAAGLEADGVTAWGVATPALWHKYIYADADLAAVKGRLDAVEGLLNTDEDKALYRFMVEARHENSPLVNTDNITPQIVDYMQVKNTLFSHITEQYLDFVVREPVQTIIHAGVFDGTDCTKFLRTFPNLTAIHGFEPRGEERIAPDTLAAIKQSGKVQIHTKGLWNTTEAVPLIGSGCYTTLCPNASQEQITGTIETTSIDEFVAHNTVEQVDYICLDVERAEERVLAGARQTIKDHRPQLAVCIYHKKEDIFQLPLLMDAMLDDYVFHIGHYYHFLNETVLYAIPRELVS